MKCPLIDNSKCICQECLSKNQSCRMPFNFDRDNFTIPADAPEPCCHCYLLIGVEVAAEEVRFCPCFGTDSGGYLIRYQRRK